MSSCLTFALFLFLLFPLQSQRDIFKAHYEKAEALRRSGNLTAAEAEFGAILGEAYYGLGRVNTAKGNYKESIRALEEASIYQPQSDAVLIALAIAYFHQEQFDKALAPLMKIVSKDPANSSAHHMLGKTHFMLADFERAIAELQTALRQNPKDLDVEYTLGLAYLKRRDLPAAKRIFDRMITKLGDKPQLRVLIGRGYRETGYLSEAIEEFKKAVALDPRFPRVHYYLGLTYLLRDGSEKIGEAERQFKLELAEHPDEFFANYYLGITSVVGRNWVAAVEFMEKASRLQPKNPDPYFFLGQALAGLEKHQQAVDAFRKSIAFTVDVKHNDYQVGNAHYRLGQSLIKLGMTEEGQKELKVSSELKTAAFRGDEARTQASADAARGKISDLVAPEGLIAETPVLDSATQELLHKEADFYKKVIAVGHNNLGMLRAERQDFRTATEQFRIAATWDPNLEGVNFNLGLACYKAELYAEAVSPLESELKAHPENLAAKKLLGLSYFMADNHERASALLSEVVAANPRDTTILFPLTLSLINAKKTDAANELIRQMVAQGTSPQLHILMGWAAQDQGDSAKAVEELKTAISLDSKVQLAHFYLGVVYLKQGQFQEARKEFEAELALNPNDIQAKYHLGYVILGGQDTELGIKVMKEVVAQKPQFSDARYELGKALLQQGDLKGAIENLEIAEKLDPSKAHIHYQLGRAYLAAGRQSEGNGQIEISKQIKEKERAQTNP